MDYENILNIKPYSLQKDAKRRLYGEWLTELTNFHRRHCPAYASLLKGLGVGMEESLEEEQIPMVPVGVFKDMDLRSISQEEVFKTVTSSGTKGQAVSTIQLDAGTAKNQQMALASIGADFWGGERLPFLVIDSPEVLKNRKMFSARGAGILGFSLFASRITYALDREMRLDMDAVESFLKANAGQKTLVFGFTYMIWKYFYQALEKQGIHLSMDQAILVHGGGWKKLEHEAVSPREFKEGLEKVAGIRRIHNYYGMAEQTGCIYMECEAGHLHASVFSDVIIRRGEDFEPCQPGEEGIIQVLSPLPGSYPGHSLLTEDRGVILGEDDCPCGRLGKYFAVTGRISKAQVRGCSDTYEG